LKRLVLAPNWLGDCVMALPFLEAIKRDDPGRSTTVLCRPAHAPLFRLSPAVDRVVPAAPGLALFREARRLARERFDEAFVLPHSFRSAAAAYLTGARRRTGYAGEGRGFLLTDTPERPALTRHQLQDDDALLAAFGIAPNPDPPRIAPAPDALSRMERLLVAEQLRDPPTGTGPVMLAPGGAFGPTKRWPAERFAFLADALMDEGRRAAVLIGPGEVELGRRVAYRARHRIPVVGGDLDTGELAALLSLAVLLVGNDSGPAHLAAAVGTPVVEFFGPTDPGRTAASGAPVAVLDRYVFCSPCYLKTCPYGHECMEEISVEMAHAAARRLLRENGVS
jgi:heptosyltransferase-2